MDKKVYAYGRHAIEAAREYAMHAVKKVSEGVNGVQDGIVALIDVDELMMSYEKFLEMRLQGAVVVLDHLEDPHNVGAIIRSAAALGAAAVLIPTKNQAQITSAVIKVSAGMAFRLPLVSIDSVTATLTDLKSRGYHIYGLDMHGSRLVDEAFDSPTVLIVGNEGAGISPETRALCTRTLSVPMDARAESLNAAAAAAIALYAWSVKN